MSIVLSATFLLGVLAGFGLSELIRSKAQSIVGWALLVIVLILVLR